jgi:L-ascorbate metabolism protein UlaG (beta-lactamase superfamily)
MPGALELRFLGHATVALHLDGIDLLTDPVLRRRVAHLRHHQPHVVDPEPTAPGAVLISHIHQDHLDLPSLARFSRGTHLIVPRGAGRMLERRGYTAIEELEEGSATSVGAIRIRATHARHHGRRPPFGPTAACLGYVVEGTRRIYFAGDTALFPGMAALGPIDVALLPIWGWGGRLGPGHLDPLSAAEALALIRPSVAVPIHWGSLFPLALARGRQRHLTEPPRRFAAAAASRAPEVDVRILQPGETLRLAATRP